MIQRFAVLAALFPIADGKKADPFGNQIAAGLQARQQQQRLELLRPTESLFSDLPSLTPNKFNAHLLRSGCTVLCGKLGIPEERSTVGERLRLCDERGFFSLGEVVETEEGAAVKPIKKFRLD